ncbi:aldehyde dehydrogenase family protein [Mesorhizobium sp. ANAO-SY3R2]|uniref:aldehyde dehydrogenase family protein n=1 Tax=Mesorhizobium sp. ANAO-SY3R2 TaxID=3166644 RepID=UPI00366E2E74
MNIEAEQLVAEYFATGTLSGLPDRHFIDGAWHASMFGDRMESFDPGLGRAFHDFAAGGKPETDAAVEAASRAMKGAWGQMTPSARGSLLMRVAGLIRENAPRLAVVESLDVGKPLQEAEGDVAGAARCFEYYAGAADKMEGASLPFGRDHIGFTVNEPVGVTAHIVPWNYPISTLARSIAPALAAGCTAVVKPAEQTPLTALMLAEILQQAGVPNGVVNVVLGTGASAGAALVANPGIRHITFTGSVDTGIAVMRAAANNVASVVLELGGKSPAVVLADADLDRAADDIIGAIFENAGQICSAGSRLVVERPAHAELVGKLVERAGRLAIGHGLRRPRLGPVNSHQHLLKIASYADGAKSRGIALATGGNACIDPASGAGWFFQPTIFDAVPADDALIQEEIFGPVLAVQVADDADHAVALANGTQFGLVAGIYTSDFAAAHRMARDIDAGQIFVNEYFTGGILAPFGGNKKSGIGREKGIQALRNYCKVKTITARIAGHDR